MMVALSGFWEAFFLLLVFVPLVFLWAFGLVDLFRRRDLAGWAKGLWALFIVLVPLVGMLVYFIARPAAADERAYRDREHQRYDDAMRLGFGSSPRGDPRRY